MHIKCNFIDLIAIRDLIYLAKGMPGYNHISENSRNIINNLEYCVCKELDNVKSFNQLIVINTHLSDK